MYLTKDEERIYSGEYGEVVEKAIKIIVKVGEALGASRLVQVSHVHISGVSYFNIGDEGLELLRDLRDKGARVQVYTTANPYSLAGLGLYKEKEITEKQLEIIKILTDIGVEPQSFTCIPYKLRKPGLGEHLAWAESSAVIYANSVIGAKTNREGGLIALMAAIIGRTYYAGMHLDSERVARITIIPTFEIDSILMASLLGLYIGRISKTIPYIKAKFKVQNNIALDIMIRNMLASIASTSDIPLAVIDGITPEGTYSVEEEERIDIDRKDIEEHIHYCNSDTLLLGCPHIEPHELQYILDHSNMRTLMNYGIKRILVTMPKISLNAEVNEIIQKIKEKFKISVEIFPGACAVVSNLSMLGFSVIATPHGKALHYLPSLAGVKACPINV